MDDFKFSIVESFGVLSESKAGWTMELNKVSWSDRPAKFDLRTWSPDHEKMGKGVTLSEEEIVKLRDLLNKLSF
ncbi:MAG: YdbC family protein [Treponema sp.]|jgi:hypothetical protein|nr:YdbC family protein [Treponema sp.]MBQ2081474.1 YdbC family protein [Treponema sp.]MBR6296298.1 YdbC family protein [Treponema sp.]MEE3313688.1 YdbC family protein [Treponema sp.]